MRIGRTAAAAGVLVALIAGCAAEPEPVQVDPAPVVLNEPAPPAEDLGSVVLPVPLAQFEVVAPGWVDTPRESEGMLLGAVSPDTPEDPLRFVATDSSGTVLWEARRPPSCTGFALSRAGDRPVAVLTDLSSTDDAVAQTTASGYDLATGEQLWGPVEVPGPLEGPGLVFTSASPSPTVGQGGERVALDPATGSTVHDEADKPGTRVVGEYDGTVLVATAGKLGAIEPGGETRWSLPLETLGVSEDGRAASVPGTRPPAGTALVGTAGTGRGALVEIADGTVITTDVQSARRDPASGTIVTVAGPVVSGHADGTKLWTRLLEGGASLAGVGGVLAYLRVGDAVQVLNAATGEDATVYPDDASGRIGVPSHFTGDGAAVIALEEHLLVTSRPAQ